MFAEQEQADEDDAYESEDGERPEDRTSQGIVVSEDEISSNKGINPRSFYGPTTSTRKAQLLSLVADRKKKSSRSVTDAQSEDEEDAPRVTRTTRSKGIGKVVMLPYKGADSSDDDDLIVSDLVPRGTRKSARAVRPTTRAVETRTASRKKSRRSVDSDYDSDEGTRRSSETTIPCEVLSSGRSPSSDS